MPNLGSWRAALAAVLVLAGCAASPPPSNVLPFDEAVAAASDGLVAQAKRVSALRPGAPRVVVVADPMLEAKTGEQTDATVLVGRRVGERLAGQLDALDLVPLDAAALPRARFLLTGTLTRALGDRPKGTLLIQLALTELKTGRVVAQVRALAGDDGIAAAPLPCEADSPVHLRDKAVDAYVALSATGAGQAAPPFYLERLAAAAHAADGARLCNDGQPAAALERFTRAAAEPGGDSVRILNGLYVTNSRVGRSADAEQAFGRLVGAGLADRQFDVKFLFNPGSTVLTSDARYALWLRRIARATVTARACLQVVGHAGAAGSGTAADALSLQRASFIRQRLVGEAAVLGTRTRAIGAGARQNLVGSGTDNAVDVLDHRVEFRVVGCP